eukprot:TRINITY_DN54925_c0_g1_i1.p1 TRINITY_DN54925_c0_g1~~TRINITY_DN54925_c0_g1_i1.p1  ORF type:complete len:342 (+),score=71.04 TRINITY_DN54925_c0_g1_i1:36-1061(+)
MIDQRKYYSTYHGHDPRYLKLIHDEFRQRHGSIIFLAGDSSLDNKFWFSKTEDAVNGYERLLSPPRMKTDVCYWLNKEIERRGLDGMSCINTAIEATSLNDRAFCRLLEQDQFIQEHITSDDYLIVSVGGNDIALAPLLLTVLNVAALVCCSPQVCIDRCACACPVNSHVDLGCMGCGLPGCLSGFMCGWPLGMGYVIDLFKNRVGNYVRQMLNGRRPKKVIVCTIYFLDEAATGSWADCALSCMCYGCNPGKLQAAIRKVYELGTSQIRIPGVEVVGFPLFEVLDGKTSSDYRERVEPSETGGAKMATALLGVVLAQGGASGDESCSASARSAPAQQAMS